MRVLLVSSYPEHRSIGGQLVDAARDYFVRQGAAVDVADLYAESFKAIDYPGDFSTYVPGAYFNLEEQQRLRQTNGTLPAELADMQRRVKDADVIIFFAPIFWGGPPAILKGWFDRVLCAGFGFERGHVYASGFLAGKKTMFVTTCAGTLGTGSEDGARRVAESYFAPLLDRPLAYCGMDGSATFAAVSPGQDVTKKAALLNAFDAHLTAQFGAPPVPPVCAAPQSPRP